MSDQVIDRYLTDFIKQLKRKDGNEFKLHSFKTIFGLIIMHIKDIFILINKGAPSISNNRLSKTKNAYSRKVNLLRKKGKAIVHHKKILSILELEKIYHILDLNSYEDVILGSIVSVGIFLNINFYLRIHFSLRASELINIKMLNLVINDKGEDKYI